MDRPRMRISAAVLGAADANELADFYERLLGWTVAEPAGHPLCLFEGEV